MWNISTVLVVDDEPDMLEVIGRVLEREGCNILTSESGEKALEILKEEKPDVVILDIMMPLMDGWEVLAKIRENPETRNMPVAILSAKGKEADRTKSFELKADAHLTKPLSREELVNSVKWICKNVPRRGY